MAQSFKNFPESSTKDRYSDSDSLSRGSFMCRIQRKPDERSLSHRSRKSQGSIRQLNLSGFYTKMNPIAIAREPKIIRQSRINSDNAAKNEKKRAPTPAHANSKLRQSQNVKSGIGELQLQLKIGQLERNIDGERVQRQAAERRAVLFQRKFKQKIKQLKQLQEELEEYRQNRGNFRSYSQVPSDKQSISTIQTIKKNYWKLRIQQLQHKNSDLNHQTDHLKHQLANLHLQTQSVRQQCQTLKQQVFILNQKTQSALVQLKQKEINSLKQILQKSSTERQELLNKLLQDHQKEHRRLIDRIGRLQIKVDFMNRRKNQEIQLVTSRKDKDIANIRKKLSLLAKQTIELKKQLSTSQVRQGLINRQMRNRRSSAHSLQLSLSP